MAATLKISALILHKVTVSTFKAMHAIPPPSGSGGGQQDVRLGTTTLAKDFFGPRKKWQRSVIAVGSGKRQILNAAIQEARSGDWRIMRQRSERHPAWADNRGFPPRSTPESKLPAIVLWLARTTAGEYYAGLLRSADFLKLPSTLQMVLCAKRKTVGLSPHRDPGHVLKTLTLDSKNERIPFVTSLPRVRITGVYVQPTNTTSAGGRPPKMPKYSGALAGTNMGITFAKYRKEQSALRVWLLRCYDPACAACGLSLKTEDGQAEVEAAHIVPVGRGGSTHVKNGMLLCRTHHWAFDYGLFYVSSNWAIVLHPKLSKKNMKLLSAIRGKKIPLPIHKKDRPDPLAFALHREQHVK